MRTVKYKTHWSYLGSGVPRQEKLVDFILDIPYLMDADGTIPPFEVLNDVLQSGGNNGGMGPGTTWRRFKIKEAEYAELVDALLNLDVNDAKQNHRFVTFEQVTVDKELNSCSTYHEWVEKKFRKKSG